MIIDRSTFVRDYYEHVYRLAHHPSQHQKATIAEFRSQINNLNRFVQFPWWCERFDNPARGLPACQLYKEFQGWLRYYYGEPEPGEDGWPVLTLGDLSDSLIVGGMQMLVEVDRELITANKLRLHNNAIWNDAVKKGLLETRPLNENSRIYLNEPVALLPDEFERVIASAEARKGNIGEVPACVWWPAAIKFIFTLGVRITAALGIPTKSLDLVRGDVLVPAWVQKQRREQRLDLFSSTVETLRDLRLEERGVPTVLGDWPKSINTLRAHYKEIIVAAEIGYDSVDEVPSSLLFHCLRRTLASMLYERHGIHIVRDRLDHSSEVVTHRYIDPRFGSKPRVRELLPDPFAPAGGDAPPLRIADCG
jgi:integrase